MQCTARISTALALLLLLAPCSALRLGEDASDRRSELWSNYTHRSNYHREDPGDEDVLAAITGALGAMKDAHEGKDELQALKQSMCGEVAGKGPGCRKDKVPATKIMLTVLTVASKALQVGALVFESVGQFIPILGGLSALINVISGQKGTNALLADLDAKLTGAIRQGVRDMTEFQLQGEIANVHAKTAALSDLQGELAERECTSELFTQVLLTDSIAGELQVSVLERAEKTNKSPIVAEALVGVAGKQLANEEILRIILLIEGLWGSWLALGVARLQMLTDAIKRFQGCGDKARAKDLTVHLKKTVLGASMQRIQESSAHREWKEKVDILIPQLSESVWDEIRKEQNGGDQSSIFEQKKIGCPLDLYAYWIPRINLLKDLSQHAAGSVDHFEAVLKKGTSRQLKPDVAAAKAQVRTVASQKIYALNGCDCVSTLWDDTDTAQLCADIAERKETCRYCNPLVNDRVESTA